MTGKRPAGFDTAPALLYMTLNSASPAACAGKKHSMMTCTFGDNLAHVMFIGPALNISSTTGAPLAVNQVKASV